MTESSSLHTAWPHDSANGSCQHRAPAVRPLVQVRDRVNGAALAVTLVHGYAHALLHDDVDDVTERATRELEAEAGGSIVGRYFGLDPSGSAFSLTVWHGEKTLDLLERLDRISSIAAEITDIVDEVIEDG